VVPVPNLFYRLTRNLQRWADKGFIVYKNNKLKKGKPSGNKA